MSGYGNGGKMENAIITRGRFEYKERASHDRIIASQSIAEDYAIVSADKFLMNVK